MPLTNTPEERARKRAAAPPRPGAPPRRAGGPATNAPAGAPKPPPAAPGRQRAPGVPGAPPRRGAPCAAAAAGLPPAQPDDAGAAAVAPAGPPAADPRRPARQLALTPAELEREVGGALAATDPAAAAACPVAFSAAARAYVPAPAADPLLVHLRLRGALAPAPPPPPPPPPDDARAEALAAGGDAAAAAEAVAMAATAALAAAAPPPHRLRNGFNSADCAAQTEHGAPRDAAAGVPPREAASASGSVSPWEIHDARANAAAASASAAKGAPGASGAAAARALERMARQNLDAGAADDFMFWDDPADGGAPGDAALLPLWRFAPTAARGRAATALAWCPAHAGLFAVGFGSFDPGSGAAGAVALVALASGGPGGERAARLPAGVLSLDWSAAAPRLLAVGCADGSVHVLDAGTAQDAPAGDAAGAGAGAAAGSGGACGATTTASPYGGLALRASSAPETRLGEGCWAVRWARGGGPGEPPALLTASPDGALVRWELGRSSVLARREAAPLGAPLCTLDAHPAAPGLLLVGTQAGEALRFDADAGGAPPAAFRPAAAAAGAAAPLVAARWSPTHPSAFLAAGADWRLRVHDAARPGERAPVRLELGGAAADAAWGPATWAGGGAPTLLAAALEGGRVAVFDLARDAAAPLCVQKVAAGGTRLTRLEFHPTRPALLVGDDRGGATLLKLPPSLRGAAVAEAAAPAAAAAAATAAAARAGARGGPPPQYRRPAARAEGGGGAGAPAMPAARLEAALEEGRRRAAAAAAFPAAMAAADAAARRPSVA